MRFDVIVVLGCRVQSLEGLSGAAARRVARAAKAYQDGLAPRIIASGGKTWGGVMEARAYAEELVRRSVPRAHVHCEERSYRTLQNARFVAEMLEAERWSRVAVVTCDWHMPRALAAFRRYGVEATPIAAVAPRPPLPRSAARALRERLQRVFDRVLFRVEGR